MVMLVYQRVRVYRANCWNEKMNQSRPGLELLRAVQERDLAAGRVHALSG